MISYLSKFLLPYLKKKNTIIVYMFVTSFYEIYGKPERVPLYFKWFEPLGHSGLSIIVFTEEEFVYLFDEYPKTVQVIVLPLKSLEMYQICMNYDRELPAYRTPEKDTHEFLALMNTKIDLLKHAAEYCQDDTLIWIDFGIFKIFKKPKKCIAKLYQLSKLSFTQIVIPGCDTYGQRSCSADSVNWRFCGGFVIVPRSLLTYFYERSKSVLCSFCDQEQYKLTWEVNIWYVVEFFSNRKDIQWYHAGHEDTMILNIDDVLEQSVLNE
jgi:hypothetical protein